MNIIKKENNKIKEEMEYNWFSLINFWKIYKKYVELDKDKNGMLSKEELIKYGPGLTSIFIDRIFEEYQRYENALDFKQFIDFVLAMENRKDPASIQFIWRAIDVNHNNKVDTFVINMFYRGVIKKLLNREKGEYRIDDIKDKNGMLSKEELIKYGPGLTSIFIDRIFEEYQRYDNAIDFKQFIDFVLAMENRKDPASIQFIWRAIDVYHKNAVDTFVINMFYRAVIKKLYNRDRGEYRIDDIKDEIWDMIGPKNPNYITLEDVLKSSYRDQVLSLLIDAKAFYQHDQKEQPFIEEFNELEGEDYN